MTNLISFLDAAIYLAPIALTIGYLTLVTIRSLRRFA